MTASNKPFLADLPTEIVVLILKSTTVPAAVKATATCRRLRQIWCQHSLEIAHAALLHVHTITALDDAIRVAVLETLPTALHCDSLTDVDKLAMSLPVHLWLPRLFLNARRATHAHQRYVKTHYRFLNAPRYDGPLDPDEPAYRQHDRKTMYEAYYVLRMGALAWSTMPHLREALLSRRGRLSSEEDMAYFEMRMVIVFNMSRGEHRRHGMMPKIRTTKRLNDPAASFPWLLQEWEDASDFLSGGPWELNEEELVEIAMDRDGEKRWESGDPYTEDSSEGEGVELSL